MEHGITIDEDDGVTIPPQAAFWSLSDSEAVALLREMRSMAPHRRDIARITWFRDRTLAGEASSKVLGDHPDVLAALRRIKRNALASPELIDYAMGLLTRRDSFEAEVAERRHAEYALRDKVIQRDLGRCRFCGCKTYGDAYIDHVQPIAAGGKTDLGNLVTACADCKVRKSGKTPEQAGMYVLDPEG